jgi:hypothetical protein
MIAPAVRGVIALIKKNSTYLVERGKTTDEAMDKIRAMLTR